MIRSILLSFIAFCSFSILGFSQGGKLKAYIDQKAYYAPQIGSFVEIQYQFVGYSLKYEGVEGGLQTKIAMGYAITNSLGDTVKHDLYVLQSPVMRDSIIDDFYDIQRISLEPGTYTAYIELQDIISGREPLTGQIELVVDNKSALSLSDILIAEIATKSENNTPFLKSGYEIIPRISNFYGQELNSLPYYIEIYNSQKHQDSVIGYKQRIVSSESGIEINGFTRFTRIAAGDEVIPILRTIDLSKLTTGSYNLEISLIDRDQNSICSPAIYYFERMNEQEQVISMNEVILDPAFQASITEDSLEFYLESLIPIARPAEIKQIIKTLKTENKDNYRKHIQQFWILTSGTRAFDEWNKYKKTVLMVQKLYKTNILEGYETDRGRVFLQYGPPSTVVQKESSPVEFPYEIWQYDVIQRFRNRRFIFFNPDLVNNNYRLLHSDMLGELQNYKWQEALSRKGTSNRNVDSQNGDNIDHFGGNSNYNYRQY